MDFQGTKSKVCPKEKFAQIANLKAAKFSCYVVRITGQGVMQRRQSWTEQQIWLPGVSI